MIDKVFHQPMIPYRCSRLGMHVMQLTQLRNHSILNCMAKFPHQLLGGRPLHDLLDAAPWTHHEDKPRGQGE